MKFPDQGLYAITQTEGKNNHTVLHQVKQAIAGGATVIQYRDKSPEDALALATELLAICHQHNIPLLINDDADFTLQIGADGVHIGKDDGDILNIRKKLGPNAIIGVSCYDDINLAIDAQTKGADYVAFGRFFPSGSKPLAAPAHIETLQQAKAKIHLPVVAIGGILPENGQQLLDTGADVLAVIGGIFDHDPKQSAQAYLKLFK